VAAIGLMAAVTPTLARDAIVDVPAAVIALVSAHPLIRNTVDSA
jgi:hypothetical protein